MWAKTTVTALSRDALAWGRGCRRPQARYAQAQRLNRPKPAKSFGQVLGGKGGAAGASKADRSGVGPGPRRTRAQAPPIKTPPKRAPTYSGASATVMPSRDRQAERPGGRGRLPSTGRKVAAVGQARRMPHGLRHPMERDSFGIRTSMLIVLKG
jgi:hypothetical protein